MIWASLWLSQVTPGRVLLRISPWFLCLGHRVPTSTWPPHGYLGKDVFFPLMHRKCFESRSMIRSAYLHFAGANILKLKSVLENMHFLIDFFFFAKCLKFYFGLTQIRGTKEWGSLSFFFFLLRVHSLQNPISHSAPHAFPSRTYCEVNDFKFHKVKSWRLESKVKA